MKRIAIGLLVLAHGLAHASIGVWAVADGPMWVVEPLWGCALIGYLAAGLGILRVPILRDWWKQIIMAATSASIMLLLVFVSGYGLLGTLIDVVILLLAVGIEQPPIDADVAAAEAVGVRGLHRPMLHRVVWALSGFALVYAAIVVAIRPMYLHWGTTAAERMTPLPGDELTPSARYRVDHAITIHAPASAVWAWLAQIGQDRAGFYSYDWLERLVGDDIHNADSLHAAWRLQAGDFVRATQPNYFGGRLGNLGWRVVDVVPGRALVLENWGAFVVEPIDSSTCRLIVRTRGPGTRSLAAMLAGPLNVFVFEPAHFVMQRAMMRGIRDRAERSIAS